MTEFSAILEVLTRHEVDFIVVGGVSATLGGVALQTFDLDVVHALNDENAGRLALALEELDAWFRTHPKTRLKPVRSQLALPGHALLMTRCGPLDLLGRIVGGRGYEELLPDSHALDLGLQRPVRVLSLEALLTLKLELGREKDLAAVALLRAAIRERRGE